MPKTALKLEPTLKVKLAPLVVTSARLDAMLEERLIIASKFAQAQAKADALEAKKKKADAAILKACQAKTGNDHQAIDTGEYVVCPVNSSSNYIMADLLLKAGVRPSVIAKATKKTPYSYARITKKKTVADV